MWKCGKCGEKLEDQFDSCWRCSSPKGVAEEIAMPVAEADAEKAKKWRMAYSTFRGTFATRDDLFDKAAHFATDIGPEQVLGISHSADGGDEVVTVWYWTTEDEIQD